MDLDLKNTRSVLLDLYKLHDILDLDLKNTRAALLDADWFYNMLELALENIWATLLDFDWFYCANSCSYYNSIFWQCIQDDIFIYITVLFMQLWVLHVNVTYTKNWSRTFSHSLVELIVSKRIVQIQSSSSSLGQMLCGVKTKC